AVRSRHRSVGTPAVAADTERTAQSDPRCEGRATGRCGESILVLERFEQELGHVADAHLFVLDLTLHAVFHHHVAERARDRDAARAGGDGLLRALVVHLLADALLHPHARAAGAAAHALGAVAR